ncbi:hypothetical protein [Daejeonella oryzae]|uniref:hypothetical protein n=1 Tax=Daejeonella oryzae TaxID=1122943 RepID=UPI00047C6AFE|nr:hypothetical protein [Daejeonella oryzae]
MKDFIVLFKPIKIAPSLDINRFNAEYIHLDFLIQEARRDHPSITNDFEIDKSTIRFETIDRQFCVVMLAFKK